MDKCILPFKNKKTNVRQEGDVCRVQLGHAAKCILCNKEFCEAVIVTKPQIAKMRLVGVRTNSGRENNATEGICNRFALVGEKKKSLELL